MVTLRETILVEENERLKKQVNNFKEESQNFQKLIDFSILLLTSIVYFTVFHYIMKLARIGLITIAGVSPGDLGFWFVVYLASHFFLLLIGFVLSVWAFIDIFEDELRYSLKVIIKVLSRVFSSLARDMEQEPADCFDGIDENLEKKIGIIKPKILPPRDAAGRFIKKGEGK